MGEYHEAKGYLASALLNIGKLSVDEQQFIEYLGGACDYYTGRIDQAAYLKMETEWGRPPHSASGRGTQVGGAASRLALRRGTAVVAPIYSARRGRWWQRLNLNQMPSRPRRFNRGSCFWVRKATT